VIGLPWYLLAAGIALVIFGYLVASLPGSSDRDGPRIRPRMRDDDIARELRRARRIPFATMVILAGFACILVSIGWRIARRFL
jgi:hypothetical protein